MAVFGVALAASAAAQSASTPNLPGEYPYYQFRASFSPPIAEKSEELRDEYLLGEWWGARSKHAIRGIKLALLLSRCSKISSVYTA
jgi:hypothetical protein